MAVVLPGVVLGAQQPNPRGVVGATGEGRSADSESDASVRRSATSVIARSMAQDRTQTQAQSQAVVTARPATVRGAMARSARPVVNAGNDGRGAAKAPVARSGAKSKVVNANVSRAGVARATAVFNDVSKIGGGYSSCRDAYSTCMDQICASANDTYRRCFCSNRYTGFRDTSEKLDEALKLLAQFQNNNLDAVNKTAEEVNAMYTATEGEAAIKRDTSASQKLLNNISDILAGKKTSYVNKGISGSTSTSLGVLNISGFSTTADNAFGGSSLFNSDTLDFGVFGQSSYTDISTLEGVDLYNAAMKQCTQITREACTGDAIFNLARSSYSILVTQDCNTYEKSLNAKKVSLEDTVRTAEKYLREARLNDYREHNSADVNECLTSVEAAMRQPLACGTNYELCLDYTGRYINMETGEPIFSQGLMGLSDLIVLDGNVDVVKANPKFNELLEKKKEFAESTLDRCRGIADKVWSEFKRTAMIKIAQAQDDKVEEIKSSCVGIMAECYDSQTDQLVDYAGEYQSAVGGITQLVARDTCQDKVISCAALYGDVDGCTYNDKTKKLEPNTGKKCGLQSLLALVDAVDTVKTEKGCAESIRKYAEETCAPASSDKEHSYPWGCRNHALGQKGDGANSGSNTLYALLERHAARFCRFDIGANGQYAPKDGTDAKLVENADSVIANVWNDIQNDLALQLAEECEDKYNGYWLNGTDGLSAEGRLSTFYNAVFGGDSSKTSLGGCYEDNDRTACLMWNDDTSGKIYTTYNYTTKICSFTDAYYEKRCSSDLGGRWIDGQCYVPKDE